jgi:hypothetical protein
MAWKVPGNFPDPLVIDAYRNPSANREAANFSWPIPKLHRVRKYCSDVLGWNTQYMDANVDPIIRRLLEKNIQPRIDSHFLVYQQGLRVATVASSRLATAATQITGKTMIKVAAPRKRSGKKQKKEVL